MRPVELTVEGLRSFRQPVTVTFADRELVAIIGDTGAGKSSLLEALTWALYGAATWTKHAGVLLGDGAAQMRVRLVFTADANTWQVTRAVRRRADGTPGATQAELVCCDGERPAADGVRQVDAAIERLLGLDWEAFTRTVVLPQGQFARLLTEGDVDRARILAQIWRTDELVAARAQADEALRDLTGHLERLRGRREGYPADVAAELDAAARTAAEAAQAAAAVDRAVTAAGECERAAEAEHARAGRIRAAVARLRDALDGDVAAEARALVDAGAGLDAQLRDLDERIGRQQDVVAGAEAARAAVAGELEAVGRAATTLDGLASSLDDLAGHARDVARLRAEAHDQRAQAEARHAEAVAAERRRGDAEADVQRGRRVDAAAAAAAGLDHGDDCPVCARALPDGWHPPVATGLEHAIAALHAATDAAQQARDRASRAAEAAAQTARHADERAAALDGRLEKVAEAVAGLPPALRPALPQPFTAAAVAAEDLTGALVADPRRAAHDRLRELGARDEQLRAARDALAALRDERSRLVDRRHAEVTEPATRLRARLERLCTLVAGCEEAGVELPEPVPEIAEERERLACDAQAVAAVAAAGLSAAEAAAEGAEHAARARRDELAGLLAGAQVDSTDALVARQRALHVEAARARERADELTRVAPVVDALDAQLAAGGEVAGALTDLRTLLQDGRFLRWLTLRRSRALLAVASRLLGEMTGGRYAFADITDEHDEWRVFDTETGYARSPRTLSGGESFVASLALALGMVEMVARSGGRLDALFLDEGFGALDRDNLDAAIDALETSATRGRMVAVISHVQAVAERLPDVLAVERTPAGSRARWLGAAEREGAAAADATSSVRNLLA